MTDVTDLSDWLAAQVALDERRARRRWHGSLPPQAEIEAKQARLQLAQMAAARWPTIALALLRIEAHPYAGRAGWREEWRPELSLGGSCRYGDQGALKRCSDGPVQP